MILSATLSKPTAAVSEKLGADYIRIKIKLLTASSLEAVSGKGEREYLMELYTQKQVFHKRLTSSQVQEFLEEHQGTSFKNCVQRTETEEITFLTNKKGKVTRLVKNLKEKSSPFPTGATLSKKKAYLLEEGKPVPFLIHLGVMTPEGKVIKSKYDKFRQINRFLEYIDDILPALTEKAPDRPLKIVDFGSGKSYLTFAVHYFLTQVRQIPCQITGLDLKEEVIAYCNQLSKDLDCRGLSFSVGDIAAYGENATPDLVITLHACDTATDYALSYAVSHGTTAILSVPCCQHEINSQMDLRRLEDQAFAPLLKYGLIKERFAALATDALRCQYLEKAGYKVQVLEFIDMAHTPKNLLIRAVKKSDRGSETEKKALAQAKALEDALKIAPKISQIIQ